MRFSYDTIVVDGVETLFRTKPYSSTIFNPYTLKSIDVDMWKGFTLEYLSNKFYGTTKLWWIIYDANVMLSFDEFTVGQLINIPVINVVDFANPIVMR